LEPSTTTTTTTTSTLPPACHAAADCDDGDACTGDVCTPAGCEHVAAVSLEGAECLLSAALSEPLCAPGTIAPKLERFATKKLQRALELVREAALATKPKRQQRLLDKADKTLGKIMQHKPGATTGDCLQGLEARIDDVLGALSEPPPEYPKYTIGGTVTGLEGTGLVLREVANNDLSPGNGAFTFPFAMPNGFSYTVAVATQPANPAQICTITNGSGTVTGGDVTDVVVGCITPAPDTALDAG
jgi:hypothetical protein